MKHLFQVAARTTVSTDLSDKEIFRDAHQTERHTSLFWFHYTLAQLQEEPRNPALRASLEEAQSRVNDAFLTDDQYELRQLPEES